MQQITESNRVIFDQSLLDERNYWVAKLSSVVDGSRLNLSSSVPQFSEIDPPAISLNGDIYQRLVQVTGGKPFLTYTVLMTAMSICLQRYTGDGRVVIGSPSLKADDSSTGNTLAIAIDVDPQVSFRQQLVSMRQTLLEAYERQNYPFRLLLQDLSLKDSPNSGPLFDIAMVFTGMHSELPETGNPLTLIFDQEQDRLSVQVISNDSRLSRDAITRFIGHFINLLSAALESIVADPEQRVGELRMLSADEERQVVEEWNDTAREYAREACIHELFAEQVRRRPEAIAVIADGEQVSYGELNQRANQVARRLQQLGVGPEVVVGICVERSVAMVVGLLGILKAGGAYLPLDAEYPQERLEYMLADAGVSVLLTQSELRDRLPVNDGIECLELSDWFASEAGELESGANAETLAYVIYTSGSTGQPKGVAVPHRGVVRLVQQSNYVKLDEEEVVLQMAPVSFDASTFEIWGALLNGARLVVMAAGPRSLAEIAETVQRHEVSTMWLTAGLLQVMATEQLETLREVKQLLAGGDVLGVRAVRAVLEGEGERVLINGYGPTENTTFSCCHVMQVGERVGESVPIGKPITNSTAYVLDEQLRPVPVGVRGELYLGGDGLARGYVGRAELTAERFVPNPFSTSAGERLYRTGDVVRWNAEGLVEFIGRADQQVKVRGYRIELGEIEAVLNEQPSVKESIAVVIDDGAGNKRLVAYVVEEIGSDESVSELRQKVREKLPEYMVPSQLIKLDAMPLTANGKVDRKALAAAEFELGQTRVYEAPRTAVEELLAETWAEVLGLERVGIHDNFFELGGDSILSIQSIARVNRNGLRLSPKDIFYHQTIAQLAAVAGTVTEVEAEQGLVMGPVSLTPIQHWFFEQELSEPHHFNQTLLLEIRESIEPELLGEAVQQIVRHHDALRLRFERTESGWRQYHADAAEQASFSKVDLSTVPASEQRAAIEAEAAVMQASLNLSDGPVLRVVYFDLGAGRAGRLLLVCHHLVVDGVSWRILLADLQEAYRALVAGETVQLPAKSSSFQQWSQALTEYAASGTVQEQLAHWLRAEREQVRSIPRDYEGENRVHGTSVVVESLSREETEALLQEVPGVYHTQINEVLLSGLALALGQWSESRVVLVDVEGHGREPISERVDVSRTVGWFTTIYPVLLEVGNRDEVGEVVKQVKEKVRAIPGQGLGYGVLRYLGSEEVAKRLQALPQAEVSFNYLGQIDRVLNEETLFGAASESSGNYRSESGNRRYLVEINAMTVGGRLQVSWSYSSQVHERETIATVAAAYVESLRGIIAHCASAEAGGYTPSDFPLAQLTAGELAAVVGEQRRGIEDVYPLSPMQEGLLFHSLYAPQGGLYVEQVQNLFRGALDVAALRTAWERVQERHGILRSSFRWEGLRRPLQVVQEHAALTWAEQDWRGLSSADQAMKLEAFLSTDRERGFELTQAPLMRMMVVRLGESEWQFVWSFHHILLDGWCISLLLQEVFQFYEGYRQGQVVELPRTRSYRDYISWLQQQDLGAAERYWRKRLAGFRAPTQLSVETKGHEETLSHGEQDLELSKEATKALETLAREQQVTLNTVVQGAWALLLSRYSGERDVVYGVTVSGRPAELSGVEQMVGLFINTLPLRVQIESGVELGTWLQRLQVEQAEMSQYEYSPLVEVQGWSEVERGVGLFETLVAFENYPVKPVAGEQSVSNSAVEYEQEWAMERTNYPLTLLIGPGEQLLLRALYAEPRYDAETIKRVLGHLEQVLVSMADGAQQHVGELRMLTPAEAAQVVDEWNATKREYPRESCIHELFAEQVRRRPEAIAVIADGEQASYGELDQRANQVARRLQQLGVGPEVVVGICVERSVAMVVGLLGILKAGGAYLPLDAEYPQERLEYMLADAGVSVLLTQEELRDRLPVNDGIECLELSEWFASEAGELESGATAETLAYVIYTSGSTGQPKGVAVPHRGVVRLVQQSNYVKLDEEEVVLQMAPVSFDASTFEIWGALLNGARLVVMAAGPRSLVEIAETVKQHEVSTMWLTAGLFQVMATEQLESLREVKQLLAGGDVLGVRAVQAVLAGDAGERVLINGYGPTENTTFSCCHVMRAGEIVVGESVPIGRPITNSTAYVLDEQLRPVPVGVRGELYLGGDGLARGYVGRAEMTAEKFVPNPYSAEPGARLYRTGDVVRWSAEGVIEFIGRADQQVKVRGYRIELSEVEEALRRFDGISESVVVVRTEGEGEKRLVGYVVARAELEVSELRAYLETKLPAYMIPSVFVELTELPLTSNGKVDRKALAAAELELSGTREYEAPRSEVEILLAGIWTEVLRVERVGIHDNFFELGGHSLLATQVISRVRETFTLELPLRSLFEAPNLSDFASAVEQVMREVGQVEVPPLVPVSREQVLPLSFAQQRLWFLDQLEPFSSAYHIPAAVRLSGTLKLEALERSFAEITRRHEALRTVFTMRGGDAVQEILPAGQSRLEVIDLSQYSAEEHKQEVHRRATAEAAEPFDLSRGPLLRVKVLRLSASEHVLLLTMHHIISDGWSMAVLMQELIALYDVYSRGESSSLPELPIQYADYAVWQREWLQGEVLAEQLDYWRQQLRGVPAVLELPADRTRPKVQSYRGATQVIALSEELSERLKQVSQEQGATLFITLLAAFQTLMSRYSGMDDVVVGSPIANRNRSEIEGLIGFFVNTLVLRGRVKRDEPFTELVKQVREVCLGAYAHQDVPFEQLVEELQPERSLSSQPLCQVLFALQNAPQERHEVAGLRFAPVEFESRSCRCDLTVSINEVNGRLQGVVEYSTDLFEAATITRMMGHFTNLLESIVADPEQRVGELRMLSADEVAQVVAKWNETRREYAREACIHELFAEQARRRPEAIAVIADGEQVSYGELDQRANQVARRLQQLGVGPEVVVGICVERSVAMVVGLLGILKAGGAYLPLDAEYPQERLEYMIADAGVKVLLTQSELRERLPVSDGIECVELSEWFESSDSSSELESGASAETLAYVIYTSGSTGQPKGVAVPHRGVVRLVQQSNYVKLDEEEVVLQMAPVSFDASTFEIWGALLNGARLVVMAAGPRSLAEIAETVQRHEVSTMWLTAGLFQVMAAEQLESLREVKQLLAGGDVLGVRAVQAVLDGESGARVLINGYGPTENTTFSCCHVMRAGEIVVGESVPIGRPITNSTAYVLDEQLRPVPVGVRGELYLGGDGLARGYVGRAEMTAERFVPNPFSTSAGERLYRTGDVVRWNAAGVLEFVGRADHQVKVRGYRIELGEVEEALAGFEGVSESVVVVRAEGEGEKRLVGYVVARAGAELEVSELRAYLETKLPAYMIPSVFVELTELPLTANGKVDRKALAAAEFELTQSRVYEAPRTGVEELLAGIWAEVLGVERVGIHDNFFELGGDSILSIQSIARANQAGLQLSPKDLFEHQTVAQLAAVAGIAAEVVAEQGLVTGAVSLTPIQHWFFEQEISDPHHFNQTLLLEARQAIDPEMLGQAVRQIVQHHDALRLRYERSESGWSQYHGSAEESVSFSTMDLTTVPASEQSAAIEAEAALTQASLNLTDGPVLRVVYFDLGAGRAGRLLLVCHHLVVDGVSWRILLADLQEAYGALTAGEAVQLPAKSSSFQQWSQALTEYASGEGVAAQAEYWLRAEREQVRSIPRDYDGENLVHGTAAVVESLGREETEALLQEVPGVYHTQINEVLLSALALALGEWSESRVVLVDVEGHGREPISDRVDVSRTVGWFTTIYPVLLEVNGNRDQAGEVVKQVKEQVRGIPGQGLGYGVLRYLGSDEVAKGLRELPHAEVSFNYLGQIDRVLNEETLFGAASESSGNYRSESGNRRYLVEINAMVVGGQLQVSWSYSSQVHNGDTIAALAGEYVRSLRAIIEHCASAEAGGYTPSDFPLAQLSAAELAAVIGEQRRGIEDIYPLSPMQEGLLFHSLYAPQGGLYVEQVQNRFRGALDLKALRTAWERVQERHAILRSSFRWEGLRRPLQVVAEQSSLRWHEEDWRGRSREEQEKQLCEYARAERESGFDMSEGPLHRYQVLRLADQEWQLVWSFHHILLDGWCLSLVLEEVYAIYDSLVRGEELALERPRPYRDYIGWLQQQDLKAAESYWRNRLAGFRAPTQLNVETSNENETRSYGEQDLEVSKAATKALETLARDQQVTLNTVVQGAWAVLLSRYSGERDVVYGVTVSGRPAELAGVEQMVGLFVNTLPLRVHVESDAQVGSWLQQLQAEQAEMRQYEYSPLVEVQGWSEVDRGVGLFETLLAYANHPITTMTSAQTGSSDAAVQHEQEWAMERTNYPLTLMVRPGERLLLRLLYQEQLYSRETVETVLQHLDQVLVSMAAGAQQRLGDLRMLTPAEEELIVEEWNSTEEIYPAHYRLHELIEARAKLTPHTIAVVCVGEQITYAELIERANQLANHLQRLGVGPDVLVGICAERNVAMIVGLLGILKAGGAYLPLDPDYPRERLSYMTEDAAIKVLLTQQHLLSRIPNSTHVVCLDSDWPEIEANSSTDDPVAEVDGQNIVYVIYTSGSTGKPKGVMVTNRSLVNLCYGLQAFFGDQSVKNTALITSLSFDISVNQIFPTLISGKTLHVIPNHIKYDSRAVMKYAAEHEIHLMDCVPSYLNSVLTEIGEVVETELKYLLVGGEKVERSLLQKVFTQLGEQTEVINIYGLTEITDINAFSRITSADLTQPITIGGPLQNTQIYITTNEGQLQPIGIAGELCISGDGLSRGYRNRPDLTAEKFVVNPYADGGLMCRTGDIGRWLKDGRIELFGRRDQQVKVNGYRLETGEIETALDEHPGVVKSAVVAHNMEGNNRLVAYLVTTQKETMSGAEMREYLSNRLPAYMVPTFFIELDQMPLTPNGKVDRKALPAPDQGELIIEREYVAARTPVEEKLSDIWSDVLGVEQISVHDDFFDLGGHSLLATQVISRVRKTYNVELPLRALFETPTIARFAELIEEQKDQVAKNPEPAVVPISREAYRTRNSLLITDFA